MTIDETNNKTYNIAKTLVNDIVQRKVLKMVEDFRDVIGIPRRIDQFIDEFGWLDNGYRIDISYKGKTYDSVEEAYEDNIKENARTEDKEDLMYNLLNIKYSNPVLREWLLRTGIAYIEYNTEEDTEENIYWGKCYKIGSNRLGILTMKIREEIKDGRKDKSKYKRRKKENDSL